MDVFTVLRVSIEELDNVFSIGKVCLLVILIRHDNLLVQILHRFLLCTIPHLVSSEQIVHHELSFVLSDGLTGSIHVERRVLVDHVPTSLSVEWVFMKALPRIKEVIFLLNVV